MCVEKVKKLMIYLQHLYLEKALEIISYSFILTFKLRWLGYIERMEGERLAIY